MQATNDSWYRWLTAETVHMYKYWYGNAPSDCSENHNLTESLVVDEFLGGQCT